MQHMQTDMQNMQIDMQDMQTDMQNMHIDMQNMQIDMQNMQIDMQDMHIDMQNMHIDMHSFSGYPRGLETTNCSWGGSERLRRFSEGWKSRASGRHRRGRSLVDEHAGSSKKRSDESNRAGGSERAKTFETRDGKILRMLE